MENQAEMCVLFQNRNDLHAFIYKSLYWGVWNVSKRFYCAVVFTSGKPTLILILNAINKNLTITVDNHTCPFKDSPCSCICSNLHIIYIIYTLFLYLLQWLLFVCRVVDKSCISFCSTVLNVFEVKTWLLLLLEAIRGFIIRKRYPGLFVLYLMAKNCLSHIMERETFELRFMLAKYQ